MTTSKRGGEDMMRTIAATALCVLCSASTVLAQQPPEARATNQPQGWEIGFSQETRDPAETGAVAIESTRGDANGLVTVQEIRNAGEKPVTKVRSPGSRLNRPGVERASVITARTTVHSSSGAVAPAR